MKVFTVIEMDNEGTKQDPILFEAREDAEKCAEFICCSYIEDCENFTSLKLTKEIPYWEVVDIDDGVEMLEVRVYISEEEVITAGAYGKVVRRYSNINHCDYCMEPFDSETYCAECTPRN